MNAARRELAPATGSMYPINQNGSCDNSHSRTVENSELKFSDHQLAINKLGGYLCYLMEKEKIGKTSSSESQKIKILTQYLEGVQIDPILLHQNICPWADS